MAAKTMAAILKRHENESDRNIVIETNDDNSGYKTIITVRITGKDRAKVR